MIPPRIAILNADGSTHTDFDPGEGLNGAGWAVAVLPSGKIAAGGDFTEAGGEVRTRFAVFNPDGSPDETDLAADAAVRFILPQIDGKVIVGGAFTEFAGLARGRMVRLQEDLTPDAAFAPVFDNGLNAAAMQADGKMVIAGAFATLEATARNGLARLYNNDTATRLRVESASTVTWRRTGAGQDTERVTFEMDTGSGYAPLTGTVVDTLDGWMLITGSALSGNGSIRARAFPTDGHSQGMMEETAPFDFVPVLAVSVGETVLAETDTVAYGTTQIGRTVAKTFVLSNAGLTPLTFAGTGASFASGGDGGQWSFSDPDHVLAPGETAVFVLNFTPTSAGPKAATLRFHTDDAGTPFVIHLSGSGVPGPGSVDAGFLATLGGATPAFAALALCPQADGLMVGGSFTTVNGQNRKGYARQTENGSVLTQTGAGVVGYVNAMAQLPDGKWMIGGFFTKVNGVKRSSLARLNADRTLDTTFNVAVNAPVNCILVQEDGGVIIGGSFTTVATSTRYGLARLTPSGMLDMGWVPGIMNVHCLATQADGKVYVGGSGMAKPVRLNANGTVDVTFATASSALSTVSCMAVDSEGRVLFLGGGSFKRALPTGNEDGGFSSDMVPTSIAVQANGQILASKANQVSRLDGSGEEDLSFAALAMSGLYFPLRIALAPNGGIYVGGSVLGRLINDLDGAESTLTVESATGIQWLRGGTTPEAQYVVFDLSEDGGSTWKRLGRGERIAGGWSLTTSLPAGGQVRGRAYIGSSNGSGAFHDEVTVFSGLAAPNIQVEFPSGKSVANGGSLPFPNTLQGQNQSLTLTLRNTGAAVLSGLAMTSSSPEWTVVNLGLTALEPNQTTTAVVRFAPSGGGMKTGQLRIASNVSGAKNPYLVNVTGGGIMAPAVTTKAPVITLPGTIVLKGTVAANADTASVQIRYRPNPSSAPWTYATAVTPATVSGFGITEVQTTITGLPPGTYHFQVGASNVFTGASSPVFKGPRDFTMP